MKRFCTVHRIRIYKPLGSLLHNEAEGMELCSSNRNNFSKLIDLSCAKNKAQQRFCAVFPVEQDYVGLTQIHLNSENVIAFG